MIKDNDMLNVNEEVYEMLNILGPDYINLLPQNVYQNILQNRTVTDEVKINNEVLKKQYSREATNIILGFELKYWLPNDRKKEKIELYKKNENLYKLKNENKYSQNYIFKTKDDFENNINEQEISTMELIKKDTIFQRIIKFFKKIY